MEEVTPPPTTTATVAAAAEEEEQCDHEYSDYEYDEYDYEHYEYDDEDDEEYFKARLYFTMNHGNQQDNDCNAMSLDIESVITLFIFEYLGRPIDVQRRMVHPYHVQLKQHIFRNVFMQGPRARVILCFGEQTSLESLLAKRPCLAVDDDEGATTVISGLASVCRALVQLAGHEEILGFKKGCLASPSEASVWTKFCEIDMLRCLEKLMRVYNETEVTELDEELARFEMHLKQPVRIHNFASVIKHLKKAGGETGGGTLELDKDNNLVIKHQFVEGPKMFLSDLILYVTYYFVFRRLPKDKLRDAMPLTVKWYETMEAVVGTEILDKMTKGMTITELSIAPGIKLPLTENVSLYKSDPKRYKPRKRVFTKQSDIESALGKIALFPVDMVNSNPETPGKKMNIKWSEAYGMPVEGDLPLSRLSRKQDQLKGIIQEALQIAKAGDIVVDFCSGSGHLGLMVASLFRYATVVLLENKAESLDRAKAKAKELKLSNVLFVQTNLDYFVGDFDIGLSLHACGVATDIVMQLCIQKKAHFICCPCCYGAVLDMPHIKYPRSEFFKKDLSGGSVEAVKLTPADYFCIAHGSDQSHAEEVVNTVKAKCDQGQLCMDIIDYDRKMYAEEQGYKVIATKLEPLNCTQKNRLLIGQYVGKAENKKSKKWKKKRNK